MWNGIKKSGFILLITMLVFSSCAINYEEKKAEEEEIVTRELTSKETEEEQAPTSTESEVSTALKSEEEAILESMSLEEKVYQLFIFGIEGKDLDQHTRDAIDSGLGGVIFFDRNIDNSLQLRNLVEAIKREQKDIPLFLSVDEEGGRVQRLRKVSEPIPEALSITKAQAFKYGEAIAKNLQTFELNMSFAPVLDVYSNPNNTVIGDRALSRDVNMVLELMPKVLEGMHSVDGIFSVAKHFPGHGDTLIDSHENLPVVNKSLEELESLELLPFKKAISMDIEAIMVGHILVESLDTNYPASLSEAIIKKLLREDMGYEGLVISDDMTMGAITKGYGTEEACVDFLKAGGDVMLVCHDYAVMDKSYQRVLEAVKTGELSKEEINQKVLRILRLKKNIM